MVLRVLTVVGARPNFMKAAAFIHAVDAYNRTGGDKIRHRLVHTGQHYDIRMSQVFFSALNIPNPEINLEVGSGTDAEQLAYTMLAFERVLLEDKPDWVVVVGDVNATLSCAVIAKRQHLRVAHIEAGLRSGDLTMPEEINRLVTDRLSDLLFTPDQLASENLVREGIAPEKIHFVGNIMIDTLEENRQKALQMDINAIINQNKVPGSNAPAKIQDEDPIALITLHRPSNVDHEGVFTPLVRFFLEEVVQDQILLWPVHPRARKQLEKYGLWQQVYDHPRLLIMEPVGYHEMLRLNMVAALMFTDSGGLQEECCVLGTPCLTLRWNTERPVTLVEHGGASVLVGNSIERLRSAYHNMKRQRRAPARPELWDGKTAQRIVDIILQSEKGTGVPADQLM
jgi:UDP-N-acetylglucosamine 2-epimerase (non-hydrolysing)